MSQSKTTYGKLLALCLITTVQFDLASVALVRANKPVKSQKTGDKRKGPSTKRVAATSALAFCGGAVGGGMAALIFLAFCGMPTKTNRSCSAGSSGNNNLDARAEEVAILSVNAAPAVTDKQLKALKALLEERRVIAEIGACKTPTELKAMIIPPDLRANFGINFAVEQKNWEFLKAAWLQMPADQPRILEGSLPQFVCPEGMPENLIIDAACGFDAARRQGLMYGYLHDTDREFCGSELFPDKLEEQIRKAYTFEELDEIDKVIDKYTEQNEIHLKFELQEKRVRLTLDKAKSLDELRALTATLAPEQRKSHSMQCSVEQANKRLFAKELSKIATLDDVVQVRVADHILVFPGDADGSRHDAESRKYDKYEGMLLERAKELLQGELAGITLAAQMSQLLALRHKLHKGFKLSDESVHELVALLDRHKALIDPANPWHYTIDLEEQTFAQTQASIQELADLQLPLDLTLYDGGKEGWDRSRVSAMCECFAKQLRNCIFKAGDDDATIAQKQHQLRQTFPEDFLSRYANELFVSFQIGLLALRRVVDQSLTEHRVPNQAMIAGLIASNDLREGDGVKQLLDKIDSSDGFNSLCRPIFNEFEMLGMQHFKSDLAAQHKALKNQLWMQLQQECTFNQDDDDAVRAEKATLLERCWCFWSLDEQPRKWINAEIIRFKRAQWCKRAQSSDRDSVESLHKDSGSD